MINSEGKQSEAIETLLKEHGVEPELDEHTGLVQILGMRSEDNLRRLRERHDLEPPVDRLHERKNELYRQSLEEGVDVMPGLMELLDELRRAPVKKALASGSSREDIELVLQHLELEDYFDAVVSGYEVTHSKPAPDIFLAAAKRLSVNPRHVMVLEDAGAGVKAAKAAGMKVIAVKNEYSAGQDFSQADLVVDSLHAASWPRLQTLF